MTKKIIFSLGAVLLLLAAIFAVGSISRAQAAYGSISASTQTCTNFDVRGVCTTYITWDARDVSDSATVYVDTDGGFRSLFSYQNSCTGTNCPASWIQCGHTYNFGLYEYNSLTGYVGSKLSSVSVRGDSCPVTEAPSPTASLTGNGSKNFTVSAGDYINYQWNSSNADSATSYYTIDSPDSCPETGGRTSNLEWIANSLNGSNYAQVKDCQSGRTYRITYKTTQSATGKTAEDTVTIYVRPRVQSNPTLVITNPTGSTNSCGSYQFSAFYDPDGPSGNAGNQDVSYLANWSADDTSVATYAGGGAFYGKKNGTTGIRASYSGLTATGSFTVSGCGSSPDAQTLAASAVTASGATLNGNVNPNGRDTSYRFEYGTSMSLGNATNYRTMGSGASAQNVSEAITGLSGNTVYYYRIVASNSYGAAQGQIMIFTTSGSGGQGGVPIASTLNASAVSVNSATVNASVNPNSADTTYRFEYGTTWSLGDTTPTQTISSGAGAQNVSFGLTGLSANTVYYYRVVAQNSYGAASGQIMTFTTTQGGGSGSAPAASTMSATSITATSAVVNGNVNPNGFATSYRFEYGASQSLGNTTSFASAGSGNSSQQFLAMLTGLSQNSVYYYRIVASNSYGTTQGQILTFTTSQEVQGSAPFAQTQTANSILLGNATLNGYVNPNGSATSYRFEYGTTSSFGNSTSWTSLGSGTNSQSVYSQISGLQNNTTYYFRVVAQNSYGTTQGQMLSFMTDTVQQGNAPTVQTNGTGNVDQSSATVNASVNPNGYSTNYYFEYGTSQNPSWTTGYQSAGAGNYSQSVSGYLSGLSANTTYWYRAVAQNQYGTARGSLMSFTTTGSSWWNNGSAPTVQTINASSFGSGSSAQLNGYVSSNGSDAYSWFEYGTSPSTLSYTTNSANTGSQSSNSSISQTVYNLSQSTTYYFRAVARNQYGTSYGQILSFTTYGNGGYTGSQPTATTRSALAVYQNSAVLSGEADPNGGLATAWFEYGATTALGLRTANTSIGSGEYSVSVTTPATGLQSNSTYYYRVVAQNQYGTSYGQILSFQTAAPSVQVIEQPPVIRYIESTPKTVYISQPSTSYISTPTYTGVSCVTILPALNITDPKPGSEFVYTVTYRNGCNYLLNASELVVTMPLETNFISSSNPYFVKNANVLTYNLGPVNPNDQVAITIRGSVSPASKKGDTLIFSAVFNFNGQKNTFQSLVAYLTAYVGDGNGGSLFGASIFDSFKEFLGSWWLTFILLLLVIILIIWAVVRDRRRGRGGGSGNIRELRIS